MDKRLVNVTRVWQIGWVLSLLACAAISKGEAPVRLVTGNDYRPYSDVQLEGGGLVTVLVRQAFASAGLATSPVEFQPWSRGVLETKETHFDATFPYAETPERQQEFVFSDAILDVEEAFFAREDFPGNILIPASLGQKRICRPTGYNTELLKELATQATFVIETPQTLAQCLSMLKLGRVDLVFINRLVGSYTIHSMPELLGFEYKVLSMPDRLSKVGLHLMVAKNNPRAQTILEAFNRGLATLRSNGRLEQIVSEYMHPGPEAGSPEVFIVHSYWPELSWVVHQSEGIRQTLGEGYHYREFYLDTRRLTEAQYLPRVQEVTRQIQEIQPQVVFITDDNALRLVGPALEKGWVIFGGVNGSIREDFPWAPARSNVAGVLERPLLARSLIQIQSALGLKHVRTLVLAGTDETTERMLREEFGVERTMALPDGSTLKIEQSARFGDWQHRVAESEVDWDLVLVMGNQALEDEAGQRVHELDVARWLNTHSTKPVFTIHEQQIGKGLFVGGMVVSGRLMGRDMAELAKRIVADGKVPSVMEGRFQIQSEGLMLFSQSELSRWGLSLEEHARRSAFLLE